MNQGEFFLGIDVGTSAVKAVLIDRAGAVHGTGSAEHPLLTPRPLWSEQDPRQWWHAAVGAVRGALGARAGACVACVGLTGQMHGLVALDSKDEPLRPAILWNDQRTDAECEEIHRRLGRERVMKIAGKPALTGFTAPKMLWMQRHEPQLWARAARIMLPKDFVRLRLTGTWATDVADGSGTLLMDVQRRTWSEEILGALEIEPRLLPPLFESPQCCAAISASAAAETGLRVGTPVVAGAGDQAAEAAGCGIVHPGSVNVAIGTSGVVFAALGSPQSDPSGALHLYAHAVPGRWHVMGVMLSAGGSLRWARDVLCAGIGEAREQGRADAYERMLALAAEAPPGALGLTFLPYLTGERTPHADPRARGAIVGLTLSHDQRHLLRAVVEGITFGLRDCLDLLRRSGESAAHVRVSGGGARSAWWRQVMADVFDADVATINVSEGAAFGAALLAAVGGGAYRTVDEAASAIVRERTITHPGRPAVSSYEAPYARYRALYPILAATWRQGAAP